LKTGVLAEPVLVGREKELQELRSLLNAAGEGNGKTVFVSGEAGSGKTRIAHEFLNIARKQGVAVMAGFCLSDVAAPYFPFIEAFNSYFASSETDQQLENVREPGTPLSTPEPFQMIAEDRGITAWLTRTEQALKPGKPETISPQVWRDQVFAEVAKTLHAIANKEPVILFIEDVHWADSASLGLLHYIARAIKDSERVLLFATYRSGDLTTDAEGHPLPIAETLRLMRREELFTEMKLPNLRPESISKIAENMIRGKLEQELEKKLTIESRGNPLFIVESLRMLHEQKSLVQKKGQWQLTVDKLGIPSKIKDIIQRRLAVLRYTQRRVLDAASVIGEKFDVELQTAVLTLNSLDVLETLNVIANSTSLVVAQGNSYRFEHAKSRETIYEELSTPLKRGYHERIAEKLESSNSASPPLSDLAYHFTQSGNEKKAIKYSLAAGQDELARYSNSEAVKHFKFVTKTVAEKLEYAKEKESALEGLGDALYADSMYKEAMKTFEDLANTTETGVLRLRAYRKAMDSAFEFGDAIHLNELVQKAEPYAAADRLESAKVLMERGRVFAFHNKGPEALKDFEKALQIFEEECSLDDVAWALIGVGARHPAQGKPQEAIAEVLRNVALREELGDARKLEAAYCWAGYAFNLCLLEPEALKIFRKGIEVDDKMKVCSYFLLVLGSAFSVGSFMQMGNFEAALPCALKALELSKKTDSETAKGTVYSSLAMLYARLGNMEHSEEFFEKLTKLKPETLLNPWVFGRLAKAVFFAGKCQWKESNQYFQEMFEWFKVVPGAGGTIVTTKLFYAWALEKQGRLEEAKVQLEEAQKIRDEAQARFKHANVHAYLMVRRQVAVDEDFEMRLDLVNASRKPGLLVKAEDVIPSDGFKVTALPSWCSLQNDWIEMNNREIGAFQVETVKLTLQGVKPGTFTLSPKAVYIDELGETKTVSLNTATITVQPTQTSIHVLPGRVSTGFNELDDLLGGGIPEKYAVVLASPSSDERSILIKLFLEAGATAGETTFYLTSEAGNGKPLAEKYQSNFYLFLCNPRADTMMQSTPNVVKLRGVENLTEIDIALTKAFRTLNPSEAGPRRACIEIVSDVLLQQHAVVTRKWLSGLLSDLKAKGFTALAVLDPEVHPSEESRAIIGLFDGEITVTEKETAKGREKILQVRKLVNQKYLEDELTLTKEKLAS